MPGYAKKDHTHDGYASESDIKKYINDNICFRDYISTNEYVGGSEDDHVSGNYTYFTLETSIVYSEVILLVDFSGLETTFTATDFWVSIVIPMPQYVTQTSIRTTYLLNSNNYGYVEFSNNGHIIILTRVFYKGTEYSSSKNPDMFKKVKWKAIPRYIL